VGAVLLPGALAFAQTPGAPPPQPGRFEITVLGGYRFEGSLETKSNPGTPALDLGNAATFGLALDWRVDRYADLEIQYGYTNSPATVTLPNVNPPHTTYDMGIHDVTFGFIANLVPAGRPIRPYLGLGLGFTVLVPSNELPATTKLTFSVAAGLRAYLSDRFGLRFEARWAPVYLFSTGPGTQNCYWFGFDYFCTSNDTGHVIEQTDLRLGVIYRF
jgi:hypothetical protein